MYSTHTKKKAFCISKMSSGSPAEGEVSINSSILGRVTLLLRGGKMYSASASSCSGLYELNCFYSHPSYKKKNNVNTSAK